MSDFEIDNFKEGPFTCRIMLDPDPMSPLDWDCDEDGICIHMDFGRYGEMKNTAGKALERDDVALLLGGIDLSEEDGGYEEDDFSDDVLKMRDWYIFPVFAYIHSGVTVSMGGFACPWDSGCCGLVAVSPAWLKENWTEFAGFDDLPEDSPERKAMAEKMEERATSVARGNVETIDQYLTGQVYGFVVEDVDGEVQESCWGFYGEQSYVETEARSAAQHMMASREDVVAHHATD